MAPITDNAWDHDRNRAGADPSLARRLAWFVGLWLAGLGVTAGAASLLRALLFL
ncbi:MAG: DUF2474 domain-containing protein [Alphaproteobacteria bacterium]